MEMLRTRRVVKIHLIMEEDGVPVLALRVNKEDGDLCTVALESLFQKKGKSTC
jgi:hypothetical protein